MPKVMGVVCSLILGLSLILTAVRGLSGGFSDRYACVRLSRAGYESYLFNIYENRVAPVHFVKISRPISLYGRHLPIKRILPFYTPGKAQEAWPPIALISTSGLF